IWIERSTPFRSTKYVCGRPATRYALLSVLSGSTTVGQVAPYCATNDRAGSTGSSVRTPTIERPSAACSASLASISGNSSRQGTQLGPQKLMSTGLPARLVRSKGRPSSVVPARGGTSLPTSALPASPLGADPPGPPPGRVAWTSTTTTSVVAIATAR